MTVSLVKTLHESEWQGVIYVTGGGAGLLSSLLTVPGASASVLEAAVPYAEKSLAQLLGEVRTAARVDVAGALGMRALSRARELAGQPRRMFGLGLTAALETTRSRRGENRAFISVQTRHSTSRLSLTLTKGRGREAEEALVAETALRFLLQSLNLEGGALSDPPPGDSMRIERALLDEKLIPLVSGEGQSVCVSGSGTSPKALLPGAFNPLHAGHSAMKAHAERWLGCRVAYEMSIANVDKPPLDFVELEGRMGSIGTENELWLTSLPLFRQKAEAFPGVTFVVGIDTIKRIAHTKYYGSPEARDASLRKFHEREVGFLVYGRNVGDGFQGLESLKLPELLASRCQGVPEAEFRNDLSSSALRGEGDA